MPRFKIQLLVLSFYYVNWGIGYVTYICTIAFQCFKTYYLPKHVSPGHYHTHALPRRD